MVDEIIAAFGCQSLRNLEWQKINKFDEPENLSFRPFTVPNQDVSTSHMMTTSMLGHFVMTHVVHISIPRATTEGAKF
jgi:hypothetical protein